MPRASLCMLGLFAVTVGLSCGGAAPRESAPPPVQAVLLPEPGLAHERPAPPPFSLTSTDGVGLAIAAVSATTVIEDPVAVTELRLSFDNPEDRTIEGRFTFTVPPGASLSRFAMKIRGAWMESEVVEKQRARVTYEEFLHQKRDPALLEQGAGNELAVRVFPIFAKERKELVVTYTETLTERAPYRLRFAGLPTVAKLDAEVFRGGNAIAVHHALDTKPAGDLLVPRDQWSSDEDVGIRAGKEALVRVRIPDAASAREAFDSAVILVDTSASRALDMSRGVAALRDVVAALPPDAPISVACFDQQVEPIYAGPAKAFGDEHVKRIEQRGALGASDLARALVWARKTGAALAQPRLVIVSDGVATVGAKEVGDIKRITARLGESGFVRADAVVLGGIRDESLLAAVTKSELPNAGVIVGAEEGRAQIARRLGSKTLPSMAVSADGADWVQPAAVHGAQPGDEIVVALETKHKSPTVRIGPYAMRPAVREAGQPVVARSVALARIDAIDADETLTAEARQAQIVALSTKHRIVSDHTAMLVLETEQDYDRFKIDRTANLDVLSIVDGRVALRSVPRGASIATATKSSPWDRQDSPGTDALSARGNMWGSEPGDSFGLGLSGIGEGGGGRSEGVGLGSVGAIGRGAGTGTGQGFGAGSGRLGGAHRTRPPQVRMGATSVSGRLPPEVVQRIVRQNFGRFRGCYEAELGRSSTASGRVSVRFVIARDGSVRSAQDAGSTITSRTFINCVTQAFMGLTFPQPENGVVTVTYPIVFGPPDSQSEVAETAIGIPAPRQRMPRPGDSRIAPLPPPTNPYEGRFDKVMQLVSRRDAKGALAEAIAWRADSPGDVLAYVALGEAAELARDKTLAARAYGSILELWSYRVDMLRLAGERLDRVGDEASLDLAAASYAAAVADRPDHPSSHRLRAMSLLRLGRPAEAFDALAKGIDRNYADGRFQGVETILRDDLALAATSWAAAEPAKRSEIAERLEKYNRTLLTSPSLRFVLVWETDASDVDLHVSDGRGDHAYYGNKTLVSGGRLEADVTTGYGPEAFTIDNAPKAYPYRLLVRYYARGPMGFGMGKVQVIGHDGKGKLSFDERPFVLMKDHAIIDLGEVRPAGSPEASVASR